MVLVLNYLFQGFFLEKVEVGPRHHQFCNRRKYKPINYIHFSHHKHAFILAHRFLPIQHLSILLTSAWHILGHEFQNNFPLIWYLDFNYLMTLTRQDLPHFIQSSLRSSWWLKIFERFHDPYFKFFLWLQSCEVWMTVKWKNISIWIFFIIVVLCGRSHQHNQCQILCTLSERTNAIGNNFDKTLKRLR